MFTPLAANPLLPTNNPLLPKETQASSSQKNTLFLIETVPALTFRQGFLSFPPTETPSKHSLFWLWFACASPKLLSKQWEVAVINNRSSDWLIWPPSPIIPKVACQVLRILQGGPINDQINLFWLTLSLGGEPFAQGWWVSARAGCEEREKIEGIMKV